MNIKFLVVSPNERDASSFYRAIGPMSYLQKNTKHDISFDVSNLKEGFYWNNLVQYDFIFLHRPCREVDVTLIKIAKNCNIPVWIDYDDWLFEVPNWNKASSFYHQNKTQSAVAHCLNAADLVTVSTAPLLEKFSLVNENVVLIPNAYRSDLFSYREKGSVVRGSNIGMWRGSDTHDGDLLSVREGFQKNTHKIYFIGSASWLLLSGLNPKTYTRLPGMDLFVYMRSIYELKPKVAIFPLVDCFFNRCKSNIAYIEAMHAGALCVAPDFPEWRRPGIFNFKAHDSDSFLETLNEAFSLSSEEHQKRANTGYNEMLNTYDISKINETRMQCIKTLIETPVKQKLDQFNELHALHTISLLKQDQEEIKTG